MPIYGTTIADGEREYSVSLHYEKFDGTYSLTVSCEEEDLDYAANGLSEGQMRRYAAALQGLLETPILKSFESLLEESR